MKYLGYARVSTKEQSVDAQISKIEKFCEYKGYECEMYSETVSAIKERVEFEKVMKRLEAEDVAGIIVTSLDRLGRSVMDLSRAIHHIKETMKKEVIIIDQNIDTSTKEGRLLLNLLASIAEFEREMIRERLKAGKDYSKNYGGRKRKELPMKTIIEHYYKGASYAYLAKMFHTSKGTIYRRFKELKIVGGDRLKEFKEQVK